MLDHTKKLQFIQNMTSHALGRIERTENVPHHDGKMSHDKMLSFVEKMAKHGLNGVQHFDSGGGVLGGINGVLGLNNNFQAQNANFDSGTNKAQMDAAYSGAQGALNQQQGQATTLTGQLNQGAGAQTELSGMLMDQAHGKGPNVAQNQLNQNTAANIQQQAALAAGQRGAGANAGLIARQNAQQGAATQQAAVGQAATLQSQQQLAAQNQLQNLSGAQISQGANAVNSLSQAQQNEQGMLLNANAAANNAKAQMQANVNNANAGISMGNQQQRANTMSNIMSGASSAAMLASGGAVKRFAPGGFTGQWTNNVSTEGPGQLATMALTPEKEVPMKTPGAPKPPGKKDTTTSTANQLDARDADNGQISMAGGPADAGMAMPMSGVGSMGMIAAQGGLAADGGGVKAHDKSEKAIKKDNSYANDKIPALLSEGEVVIPRSITTHPMAPELAAEFVRRTLAKKGLRK